MALRTNEADKLERTGPDEDKRYFGKYLGYVRDNLDPERRGRVRVYCPEAMGEVDNADTWLGWAEAEAAGSGYDQGMFSVPTMPEDAPRDDDDPTSPFNTTRVWVQFRDGDPAKPIYSSGGPWIGGELIQNHAPVLTDVDNRGDESIATPNGTASSVKVEASYEDGALTEGIVVDEPVPSTQATYPRNSVLKSSGGSIIELDDTPAGERIKIFHPSGSYIEINQSGTVIHRTTGKKVEFVSDERFSSIRGPSTEVYQATRHLQVDRSAQEIYRDSRLIVVEKAERKFNKAATDLTVAGLYNVQVGSCKIESRAKIDLIGADAVSIGGTDVNTQAVRASLMGTESCEVVGFDEGVRLIGAAREPSHPIYASRDIRTELTTKVVGLISGISPVISTLTMAGVPVVDFATFIVWKEAVDEALEEIRNIFRDNLTVHEASKE